jgi:predicted proteasome-type protease
MNFLLNENFELNFLENTIADMNDQFKSHKDEWESEIKIVFERLKRVGIKHSHLHSHSFQFSIISFINYI